jgi:hypothetical protein
MINSHPSRLFEHCLTRNIKLGFLIVNFAETSLFFIDKLVFNWSNSFISIFISVHIVCLLYSIVLVRTSDGIVQSICFTIHLPIIAIWGVAFGHYPLWHFITNMVVAAIYLGAWIWTFARMYDFEPTDNDSDSDSESESSIELTDEQARHMMASLVNIHINTFIANVPLPDKEFRCSICLDETNDEDKNTIFSKLACDHIYHRHCIKKWLLLNLRCPLCNAVVGADDTASIV